MKKIIALAIASFLGLTAFAQRPIYLLPESVKGHMVFANGSTADVYWNFDTCYQKIYFLQGKNIMEMTNMESLVSLTSEDRKFVMHDGRLCEVIDRDGEQTLVNWKFRKVNKGSIGAMGATTQNKVEVLWSHLDEDEYVEGGINAFQQGEHAREVWTERSDNTYYFEVDGVFCGAKRLKDLYKAFPEAAPQLKAFVKQNKLTMENADNALKVLHELRQILVSL